MEPGESQPGEEEARSDGVPLAIVRGVVDLGGRLIAAVLDHRVLIAAIAGFVVVTLGYVWALPDADRAGAGDLLREVLDSLQAIVGASWLGWLGWGLLALVLSVGGPFLWFQDKRLKDQGKELQRLRQKADPARLSSENPSDLVNYGETLAARMRVDERGVVGGQSDEHPKEASIDGRRARAKRGKRKP